MQPTSEPLLVEWLKNPSEKIRNFSQDFLVGSPGYFEPCYTPTAAAVPALMDIVEDANPDVAVAGMTVLASGLGLTDGDNATIFSSIR